VSCDNVFISKGWYTLPVLEKKNIVVECFFQHGPASHRSNSCSWRHHSTFRRYYSSETSYRMISCLCTADRRFDRKWERIHVRRELVANIAAVMSTCYRAIFWMRTVKNPPAILTLPTLYWRTPVLTDFQQSTALKVTRL